MVNRIEFVHVKRSNFYQFYQTHKTTAIQYKPLPSEKLRVQLPLTTMVEKIDVS